MSCRYAESLASTRILKHSVESSRGNCGENLAWASYDQTGMNPLLVFQNALLKHIYMDVGGQIAVLSSFQQLGLIMNRLPPCSV